MLVSSLFLHCTRIRRSPGQPIRTPWRAHNCTRVGAAGIVDIANRITPLHLSYSTSRSTSPTACMTGDAALCRRLIADGADINSQEQAVGLSSLFLLLSPNLFLCLDRLLLSEAS